jgi:predicted membrane protein
MYGALWRVLPGPWWVRALILLVAAAVIIAVCVYWIFPWIQPFVSPPPPETVSG